MVFRYHRVVRASAMGNQSGASSAAASLSAGPRAATATINLTVQQPQTDATVAPELDRIALEVDGKTLGHMVETFAGIRDQLAGMAKH